MTLNMGSQALEMVHDRDPKLEILEAAKGYLERFEVLGAQVVVSLYERPEKTKGGLFLPDSVREEDKYQGKIGLILKLGHLAFVEDDTHRWGDVKPKVGDWVMFRVGDSFPFILGKKSYRFVQDVAIRAIVPRPDMVL